MIRERIEEIKKEIKDKQHEREHLFSKLQSLDKSIISLNGGLIELRRLEEENDENEE